MVKIDFDYYNNYYFYKTVTLRQVAHFLQPTTIPIRLYHETVR